MNLEGSQGGGKHVLYWMRTALRGHENPALDVARALANGRGVPLIVAAFVLRSHTYPTARRYQFWLQGLHDTQLELREQVSLHFDSGTVVLDLRSVALCSASSSTVKTSCPFASGSFAPFREMECALKCVLSACSKTAASLSSML